MSHVDALSRNSIPDLVNAEEIKEIGIFHIQQDDRLLLAQLQDSRLKYVNEVLQREAKNSEEREIKKLFLLKNHRVFRKTDDGVRWAVPRAMRHHVTRTCHDEIGHFGLDKTLAKIRSDYWFPAMKRYVTRYIKSCVGCFYAKEPAGKQPGLLHPIEKVAEPMHTLHVDHLGPFVRSTAGNSYLIVVIDAFTKFVFLKAVANTKAYLVIRFFDEIGTTFGYPVRLISDRGSAFTSKIFKAYCAGLNIKHILNAVATPRANGQVERYNRTILDALIAAILDERKWDKETPRVRWGLNNIMNRSTGKTPSQLFLGYRPRDKSEVALLNDVGESSYDRDLEETRKEVSESIKQRQVEMKARYDLRRAAPKKYKCGDAVGIKKTSVPNTGVSKKTVKRFAGPYEIKKVYDNDRYLVGDIKGCQRTQRKYESVVPVDKLKLWDAAASSEESDALLTDTEDD